MLCTLDEVHFVALLTCGSSNVCPPPCPSPPSLTYSQISETSLSCELTLWCGAVGRDPKPLIRHLNSPPTRYNFPRCVPALRLEPEAADLTDWKEGRDSAPCCSRVIYLFMEAFYSHIMGQASFPEAQKGSHARLSLNGGSQEESWWRVKQAERCWSGECLWVPVGAIPHRLDSLRWCRGFRPVLSEPSPQGPQSSLLFRPPGQKVAFAEDASGKAFSTW